MSNSPRHHLIYKTGLAHYSPSQSHSLSSGAKLNLSRPGSAFPLSKLSHSRAPLQISWIILHFFPRFFVFFFWVFWVFGLEVKCERMASNAAAGSDKRQPEQKTSADEAVVAPEVSRFPKDIDGASQGPVWQSIAVPLKADPANNPDSDEWNQAKQAFKETGLLNRISDHVADP